MSARWHIEEQARNCRTEFHFTFGGDLDDQKVVENAIVGRMGGRVIRRIAGPYSTIVLIEVMNQTIHLVVDSPDLLYFLFEHVTDRDTCKSFAIQLEKALSTPLPG